MKESNIKNWWKSPVLQGEENDYGDYDYLIEELPENTKNWLFSYQKCDTCGKYHKINFSMSTWFHTMDGGDSFDYTECWKCYWKQKILSKYHKFIKNYKDYKNIMKFAFELHKCCGKNRSFKECFFSAKKIL